MRYHGRGRRDVELALTATAPADGRAARRRAPRAPRLATGARLRAAARAGRAVTRSSPMPAPRRRPAARVFDCAVARPRLSLMLLLLPPLLWLGVVYLGSLLALLAQSFFSLDEFSGQIVHESGSPPMSSC